MGIWRLDACLRRPRFAGTKHTRQTQEGATHDVAQIVWTFGGWFDGATWYFLQFSRRTFLLILFFSNWSLPLSVPVALRLLSKGPGQVPDGNKLMNFAAQFSHYIMYGLILYLPISGIAMGYFTGYGVRLILLNIPRDAIHDCFVLWYFYLFIIFLFVDFFIC